MISCPYLSTHYTLYDIFMILFHIAKGRELKWLLCYIGQNIDKMKSIQTQSIFFCSVQTKQRHDVKCSCLRFMLSNKIQSKQIQQTHTLTNAPFHIKTKLNIPFKHKQFFSIFLFLLFNELTLKTGKLIKSSEL